MEAKYPEQSEKCNWSHYVKHWNVLKNLRRTKFHIENLATLRCKEQSLVEKLLVLCIIWGISLPTDSWTRTHLLCSIHSATHTFKLWAYKSKNNINIPSETNQWKGTVQNSFRNLTGQQNLLKGVALWSNSSACTSYRISDILASDWNSFSDKKFKIRHSCRY